MTVLDQCALEKQTNKQTNRKEKKQNKTKQKHFFEECTGFCFLVNGSPIIKKKYQSWPYHYFVNFIVLLKFAENNLPLVSSSL